MACLGCCRSPDGGESNAGASVYVVDDHRHVLEMLVELIDGTDGFSVVGSSTDAQRAEAEIEALRPAIAVVDGWIAGHDGLALCRRLRVAAPDVTCVIVTAGIGRAWSATEVAEAGVAAVLLKELTGFRLLEVLASIADGYSAGGAKR